MMDAHLHIWDLSRFSYPCLGEVGRVAHNYSRECYVEEWGDHSLLGGVFIESGVEAEAGIDEVAWISELAARNPVIKAIVAYAPLDNGCEEVRKYLYKLKEFPLVKGVRMRGALSSPLFTPSIKLLKEYGLSLDYSVREGELAEIAGGVEACSDIPIALELLGGAPLYLDDHWKREIEKLSEYSHLVCKIAALPQHIKPYLWRQEELKPYIEHLVNCFGVDRVLFGSNWPQVYSASTLRRWLEAFLWAIDDLSEEDRYKVLRDNSLRFYRL